MNLSDQSSITYTRHHTNAPKRSTKTQSTNTTTTYICHKNSNDVAHDLHNVSINNQLKIITLDIKDLYVNLPIENILAITKFLLNVFINQPQITQQILELVKTILYQNYFQYDDKYYQPTKGIAMGSPIPNTIAEIYLHYLKETIFKHWMETKEIICYKLYVDHIIIIINQHIIKEVTALEHMNNIHKHLEFKMTEELNNTTNYLDMHIYRNHDNIQMRINRKPTQTGNTINCTSNHLLFSIN